jgi:glycosyltransferase involved in cell wall biosynthesis
MQVSVVIPTYNRSYILREALESVLAQSYRDFEILVVDDGSRDNTREVVESFQCDKIRYLGNKSNRGCSAAYNVGITESKGALIAFCDSDDLWKPDYLQREVDFLCRHPEVDVVFCDTEVRVSPGGAVIMPSLMQQMPAFRELIGSKADTVEHVLQARQMYLCLLEEIPIKPTAAMARRAVFDRVGMFDEAWPSGTDWDLFLRFSRVASFGYIDEVLAIQRRTSDATHQVFREKDKLFLLSLFLKEKAALAGDHNAIRSVNRGISGLYNSLAWTYLEAGRKQAALSTYYRGFRETLRPMLLKKLASAVLRVARDGVSRPS